jgi:hypothetical protein
MTLASAFLYKSNIPANLRGSNQLLIIFKVTNETTVLKKKTTNIEEAYMPAKVIVFSMIITLIVLFMTFKRFRKNEVKREILEREEFEALQNKKNP